MPTHLHFSSEISIQQVDLAPNDNMVFGMWLDLLIASEGKSFDKADLCFCLFFGDGFQLLLDLPGSGAADGRWIS